MTRLPVAGLALVVGLLITGCAAEPVESEEAVPSTACVDALQDVTSGTDEMIVNARFELAVEVCQSVADLTATVEAYPDSLGLTNPTDADIEAVLAVVCPKLENARRDSPACAEVGMGLPGKR